MQCNNCGRERKLNASFCAGCGSKIDSESETDADHQSIIRRISIFFFILVGYIAALHILPLESKSYIHFIIDGIFAVIVLIFFFINFKMTIPLFNIKNIKLLPVLIIIAGALMLAFLVSYVADKLNQNLFYQSRESYVEMYSDSRFPLLLSIISVGVFPALFEELAFRGILFDDMQRLTGTISVILVTAILFTILHFSIISVLWIFPIGLVFGFLRAKYNTLLYGMIGHFCYNSFVVLIDAINS